MCAIDCLSRFFTFSFALQTTKNNICSRLSLHRGTAPKYHHPRAQITTKVNDTQTPTAVSKPSLEVTSIQRTSFPSGPRRLPSQYQPSRARAENAHALEGVLWDFSSFKIMCTPRVFAESSFSSGTRQTLLHVFCVTEPCV